MIEYKFYSKELNDLEIADGFFEYWYNKPNKNVHRKILENSYKAIVAIDNNNIIGFINIISDGVLSAYIPLLEVIPKYRKKGIGLQLTKLAIEEVKDLYMVDTACDDNLVEYYEKFEMVKGNAMILRNYKALVNL